MKHSRAKLVCIRACFRQATLLSFFHREKAYLFLHQQDGFDYRQLLRQFTLDDLIFLFLVIVLDYVLDDHLNFLFLWTICCLRVHIYKNESKISQMRQKSTYFYG